MNWKDGTEILLFETPKQWEVWLEKHHTDTKAVWLRFYKKASGKPSITYDQALDEALCFGWIDGLVHKYDDESYIQRFTPRRPKGNWSKRNTEHIARLVKEGRMRPSGLAEVEAAKKDGRWDAGYASSATITLPDDFLQELGKHKKAKAFFETLNRTNFYAIAYRLTTAKKQETYERRKKRILEMLEREEKLY